MCSLPNRHGSMRARSFSLSIDGNRNASRQYRAYEASEARISPPGTLAGGTPSTRARFLRSCAGPPLRDA